ncbi:hypothetical protein D3C75_946790 [compost metagenome]
MDTGALAQPLAKELGGLAEGYTANPLGALDLLPGLFVLVAVVAGNAEACNGITIGQIPDFQFFPKTTNAGPAV